MVIEEPKDKNVTIGKNIKIFEQYIQNNNKKVIIW